MFTAEFHSQTAIEAAKKIYADLKERGKSAEDIKDITIRTHEACVRIIDKQFKAMDNFADRDHCIQVSEDLVKMLVVTHTHNAFHALLSAVFAASSRSVSTIHQHVTALWCAQLLHKPIKTV